MGSFPDGTDYFEYKSIRISTYEEVTCLKMVEKSGHLLIGYLNGDVAVYTYSRKPIRVDFVLDAPEASNSQVIILENLGLELDSLVMADTEGKLYFSERRPHLED